MRNIARQPHLRTVAIESWQYASILFTIFWETCSPPPHSPLATKRQSFCDSRFHCMAKPTMELSSFSICDIFHFHFLIDLSTYRHANGTAKKNGYNRNVIVNRIQMKLRQANIFHIPPGANTKPRQWVLGADAEHPKAGVDSGLLQSLDNTYWGLECNRLRIKGSVCEMIYVGQTKRIALKIFRRWNTEEGDSWFPNYVFVYIWNYY